MSESERPKRDRWQRCPYCNPPKLYPTTEIAKMLVCGELENRCFKCVRCGRQIEVGRHLILTKPRQPPRKKPSGRVVLRNFGPHDTIEEGGKKTPLPPFAEEDPQGHDTINISADAMVESQALIDRTIVKIHEAIKEQIVLDSRFKLLEIIGQGTTGIVVMARNLEPRSADPFVAVKFNLDTVGSDEDGEIPRRRVKRIYGIQSRFNSTSVARPVKLLEHPVFGYITIESFIEGDSLRKVLEEGGTITEEAVIAIGLQICDVLIQAEKCGQIIHRDIKPDNIILKKLSEVKVVLIDFGLARSNEEDPRDNRAMFDSEVDDLETDEVTATLTLAGVVMGTPSYMAPEQVAGKRPDCRTDIYGLAATLYHALTSRPALTAPTLRDLLKDVEFRDPTPAIELVKGSGIEISESLSNVLTKALQKNPNHRFQTPTEFAQALEACQKGAVLELQTVNGRLVLVRQARWRKFFLAWLFLLAVAIVAVALIYLLDRASIPPSRPFK